jgi:glutamyl-tRNA synthetase
VSQFARRDRHAEVVRDLLASGAAYRDFTPPEELAREREAGEGGSAPHRSPWRDRPAPADPSAPHAVRLRVQPNDPASEEAVRVRDAVQGEVSFQRRHLEDLVLMRSDGTPLYNLAVVVDDHDMGVTHVIRGDDHLTNTFKQALIYDAMGWRRPTFAHVPLIFGPDGKKLSKRHGATATADYQAMGYLAAGMRNYLARLGWSHGDMEVFSDAEARGAFDLPGINKAPARFDFKKLESLSGEHMRRAEERALLAELDAFLAARASPPCRPRRASGFSPPCPSPRRRPRPSPSFSSSSASRWPTARWTWRRRPARRSMRRRATPCVI